MKVLVLGGAGFIGPRVMRKLLERGHDVACMDLNTNAPTLAPVRDKAQVLRGDVTLMDDVVRVFANHPDYGYGVQPENVLGLKLEIKDGKYTNVYRADWHFNWGPGKTIGIEKHFVATKGYGPALVCGDSDGDAWMMKDFADTRLGVIINRLHTGQIGANSQQAAATLGQPNARFLLQGRDENTGRFNGQEATLKYGQTEARLLA